MRNKSMVRTDRNIYCLNSAAVGDLIAAAPSVKYAIDNYHLETDYKVAIYPEFKDFYPFVPNNKFIELVDSYDGSYAVRKLNMDGGKGNVTRLTPSRMKLTQYANVGLLGRILPDEYSKYIPMVKAKIDKYELDFSNTAIFLTTYRDVTRAWKGEDIVKTAKYVYDQGITPVFVGKTGAISIWKTLAVTDFEYPGFGIDLIDKTSLRELYTIMSKAKVIFGMDSGPLHIAFATDTPVVAGFTNVEPSLRIPVRNPGVQTVSVTSPLDCRFCQSNWNLDFHNFTKCPRQFEIPECTLTMTAENFIEGFKQLNL